MQHVGPAVVARPRPAPQRRASPAPPTGKATDLPSLPGQSLAATGVDNAVLQLGLDGTGTRLSRK